MRKKKLNKRGRLRKRKRLKRLIIAYLMRAIVMLITIILIVYNGKYFFAMFSKKNNPTKAPLSGETVSLDLAVP